MPMQPPQNAQPQIGRDGEAHHRTLQRIGNRPRQAEYQRRPDQRPKVIRQKLFPPALCGHIDQRAQIPRRPNIKETKADCGDGKQQDDPAALPQRPMQKSPQRLGRDGIVIGLKRRESVLEGAKYAHSSQYGPRGTQDDYRKAGSPTPVP